MRSRHSIEERKAEVREQQRPIAEWLRAVMAQKKVKATEWAKLAGLGRDTVSRAVREDYNHVTSTTTLLKLAKAVGVQAPIDLGSNIPGVPSAPVLAAIINQMLVILVPEREWDEDTIQGLGKALRHTLLELSEDREAVPTLAEAETAARMAMRSLPDQDNEPRGPKK